MSISVNWNLSIFLENFLFIVNSIFRKATYDKSHSQAIPKPRVLNRN